ncbi:hypothetical protein MMC25_007949 [Agyrium rufum]|nr:hypothetical protein [Agyrium rufum]
MNRAISTTALHTESQHGHNISTSYLDTMDNEAMDIDTTPASSAATTGDSNTQTTTMNPSSTSSLQASPISSQMPPPPPPSSFPRPAAQSPSPTSQNNSQGSLAEEWQPLLLSQKSYQPQLPNPTQDLLSVFGLSKLISTVTRVDPKTGEKINKMRRSYEGQVKSFGLAGRNKSVKHDEGAPGGFLEMMQWPEEEWRNQKVFGNEIEKGLSSATKEKLSKAFKLEKGLVPSRNDEWENILGHDRLKPPPPGQATAMQGKKKEGVVNTAAGLQIPSISTKAGKQVNGRMNVTSAATSPDPSVPGPNEAARPKRVARKRRYDEDSYVGYGEGYEDDEEERGTTGGNGGYDSDTGSKLSSNSRKRRKKVSSSS